MVLNHKLGDMKIGTREESFASLQMLKKANFFNYTLDVKKLIKKPYQIEHIIEIFIKFKGA
jgi:hypothetical protein